MCEKQIVTDNKFKDLKSFIKEENDKDTYIVYKILNSFLEKTDKTQPLEGDEIFLSEADLQFSFAQRAKEMGATDIILEYPIKTATLYSVHEEKTKSWKTSVKKSFMKSYKKLKCPDSNCTKKCDNCKRGYRYNNDRTSIDLKFKYGKDTYFVEFKYKTSKINKPVKRYTEKDIFTINHQGAENLGRYEIYEDIERMECIKECTNISKDIKSYVVFITNESKYWRLAGRESAYKNFSLEREGSNTHCIEENLKEPLQYISDNPPRELYIFKKYNINWCNFHEVTGSLNNEFKALIIDLQKTDKDSK